MYVLIYWKTDHIESVVEYSFRLTEIFILEKGGRQNMGEGESLDEARSPRG